MAGDLGRASYRGSEGGPVTLPVFKTGDWRLAASMVRSTRTRFRQKFGNFKVRTFRSTQAGVAMLLKHGLHDPPLPQEPLG